MAGFYIIDLYAERKHSQHTLSGVDHDLNFRSNGLPVQHFEPPQADP